MHIVFYSLPNLCDVCEKRTLFARATRRHLCHKQELCTTPQNNWHQKEAKTYISAPCLYIYRYKNKFKMK